MKKIRRLLTVLAVAITALLVLPGNTGVDIYQQKHGMLGMVTYVVTVDSTTVKEWDNSSLKAFNEGKIAKAYSTVEYAELFGKTVFGADSYAVEMLDGSVVATFLYADVYVSPAETDKTYKSTRKKSFFYSYYEVTRANPLKIMVDEIQNGEAKEGGITDSLANGVSEHGKVVLPAFKSVFPVAEEFTLGDFELNYYFATPMWFGSSDADQVTSVDGVKCAIWKKTLDGDLPETISYSYYTPNSIGWGAALVLLALTVVGVMLLFVKEKKPVLVDNRTGAEYEFTARMHDKLHPKQPEEPKEGYNGNGVFVENGKSVDVFGNESESAPSAENKKENTVYTSEDIFGNDAD